MSRAGTPPGTDLSTVVWLSCRQGIITAEDSGAVDGGGNKVGQTVTATTTSGANPALTGGYYAGGILFDAVGGATGKRLEVVDAGGGTLSFAGDFTLDLYVRVDGGTGTAYSIISRRDQTGAQNDALDLWVNTSGDINFDIWDAAQTKDSIITQDNLYPGRWTRVKAWVNIGTAFGILVDGRPVAQSSTALANIASASLGPLQVGGHTANAGALSLQGAVSDVRIRTVLDSSGATCCPNVQPSRVTRRHYQSTHIDRLQTAQQASWTADGDNFYVEVDGADVGELGLVVDWQDVVSVKATTGTTTTTFARVGAVAALSSDEWCLDQTTDPFRFYSSENPAGYDTFAVAVRDRLATRGRVVGGRYYRPTVLSAEAGERACGFIFEAIPTGAGAKMSIAQQHPDNPTAWLDPAASGSIWKGAAVAMYTTSDGMPWSEATRTFSGFIDSPPKGDQDAISVTALTDAARLHRLPALRKVANDSDWPDMAASSDNHAFPVLIGKGHQRVKAVLVDAKGEANPHVASIIMYQYKISAVPFVPVAIGPCFVDGGSGGWLQRAMMHIDLDAGTFWLNVHNTLAGTRYIQDPTSVLVDVTGFGSPSGDAQSALGISHMVYGDEADAYAAAPEIIQQVVIGTLGLSAADFDSTLATTAGRVGVYLRLNQVMDSEGDLVSLLRDLCAYSSTFLYPTRAGLWGLRDVDKNEAAADTLRDCDIISESWQPSWKLLSERLDAEPWLQTINTGSGTVTLGSPAELAVKGKARFGVGGVWRPPTRPTYHYTMSAVEPWLAAHRGLFEDGPIRFYSARVPYRAAGWELMDVINLEVSSLPTGAGSRFRVLTAQPLSDGSVAVLLFPEAPFATDGTSASGERDPLSGLAPLSTIHVGDSSGIPIGAGAATAVEGAAIPWIIGSVASGALGKGGFIAGTSHRLAAYAKRIGGAADSDLTFDVYDATNTNLIATTPGFGLAAEWKGIEVFSDIPTDTARLTARSNAINGATGTLYDLAWESEEGTPTEGHWTSPTVAWHWSKVGGQAIGTGTRVHVPGSTYFIPASLGPLYGAWWMLAVYCTVSSPSGLVFELNLLDSFGTGATYLCGTAVISAGGFHTSAPYYNIFDECHLVSTLDSGNATIYEAALLVWHRANT